MLSALAIGNYRSLRDVVMPLGQLTLVTGANGSGKSNLYRALRLVADVAQGRAIGSLAREGGMPSVVWAGPEEISRQMRRGAVPVQGGPRKHRVALRMGFADDELSYTVELGYGTRGGMFSLDPEVKRESIFRGAKYSRRTAMVERTATLLEARDDEGAWQVVSNEVDSDESMLTWAGDPRSTPEVFAMRRRLQSWRFYDHFRSDRDAPARRMEIGTRTTALAADGSDLPAAIATIQQIGDPVALAAAVEAAFPGATLDVEDVGGRFRLHFHQPGLLRALDQAELSDGTLRYLLWLAALHTPRPPPLMILNEPETSLHTDLLPALGDLIVDAATRGQVWVVSHAPSLIAALQRSRACETVHLYKELGQTLVRDQTHLSRPAWTWPKR